MPHHSPATATRACAMAIAAAVVLIGGCAATIGGTAAVDGSALLSPANSPSATGANTATGTSLPVHTSMSFHLPAPPSPKATSPATTPHPTASTGTSPARATSATTSTAATNQVDVAAILAKLSSDPLYADAAATSAADPTALAALGTQVRAARAAGFPVTVALIGHEVDDLTSVTDEIATRTDGTSIGVSTSHFAVSSKDFSNAQLTAAENAAASAANPVDAAAKLITALQAQRSAATTAHTTSKPATSKRTTAATTAGADIKSWDRFQLPDGSIACMIESDTVRCDVVAHTYTPPKNPNPNCQGDYGAAVMMTASKAPAFICISDTVADPSLPKLASGGTTQVGSIMCFSDPPSVTCLSLDSAHGFVLQPDMYQFY